MKEVFHRREGALVNQACLCSGMVERWEGKKKRRMSFLPYLQKKKDKNFSDQNKLLVNILISPLADDLLPFDHHSALA